jgi:hypothetical protein
VSNDLLPTAKLHFVRAHTPDDCRPLPELLAQPAIYEVALGLGSVLSAGEFGAMLAAGDIEIWQAMRHGGQAPVALAIDSHVVGDHELYAYPLGPLDPELCADVLHALARRVFEGEQAPRAVFTAWSLPVPPKLRQAIERVGWEPIASETDRGVKKSFWLENVIYALYAEDGVAPEEAADGPAGGL